MSTLHSQMSGSELHDAYHFVQESDPGAVGAGKNWLQISTSRVRRRNSGNSGWDTIGAGNFIQLGDTPGTYAGQAGLFARVKGDETGLEFVIAPGSSGISWVSPPSSETDTGTLGDLAYDKNGIYNCIATNLWRFLPSVAFPGARGTYTYVSNGDTNGIFYALGNYIGGGTWTNPYLAGLIGLDFNSGISVGTYDLVVDRATSDVASNNTANSALRVDLGAGRSLQVSAYSFRARSSSGALPTAWVLQGSRDKVNWTTLDAQTGLSFTTNQWLSNNVISSVGYRYLQIKMTAIDSSGFNFFTIGELEFYGIFK